MSSFRIPKCFLSRAFLPILSPLILRAILWGGYYHSLFSGDAAEEQRGLRHCFQSHSSWKALSPKHVPVPALPGSVQQVLRASQAWCLHHHFCWRWGCGSNLDLACASEFWFRKRILRATTRCSTTVLPVFTCLTLPTTPRKVTIVILQMRKLQWG